MKRAELLAFVAMVAVFCFSASGIHLIRKKTDSISDLPETLRRRILHFRWGEGTLHLKGDTEVRDALAQDNATLILFESVREVTFEDVHSTDLARVPWLANIKYFTGLRSVVIIGSASYRGTFLCSVLHQLTSLHLRSSNSPVLLRDLSQCPSSVGNQTNLLTLEAHGHYGQGEEIARTLVETASSWSNLRTLKLKCSLGASVRIIAQAGDLFSNLRDLDLSENEISLEGALAFVNNSQSWARLESFDLSSNILRTQGGQVIAQALQQWTELRNVSLASNSMRHQAGEAIARALHHCKKLELLDLSKNNLEDQGARAIAGFGQDWKNLQILNLELTYIQSGGLRSIVNAAQHWPKLHTLNLEDNSLAVAGALIIKGAAQNLKSIRSLNLARNQLHDNGAEALAEALREIPDMYELELRRNAMGTEGATAIVTAAQHFSSLRFLSLMENDIGPETAVAIATAARHWPNLEVLRLGQNMIGDEGVAAIAGVAESWPRLRELSLQCNDLSRTALRSIARVANRWREMRRFTMLPRKSNMYRRANDACNQGYDAFDREGMAIIINAERNWPKLDFSISFWMELMSNVPQNVPDHVDDQAPPLLPGFQDEAALNAWFLNQFGQNPPP